MGMKDCNKSGKWKEKEVYYDRETRAVQRISYYHRLLGGNPRKMNLKIAEIRDALYQDMSKRTHLEKEAERLISEPMFDEAKAVLASIDDSGIEEIDRQLGELEKENCGDFRTDTPDEPMELTLPGCGGGAPDPTFSIPCPPRKPKREIRTGREL